MRKIIIFSLAVLVLSCNRTPKNLSEINLDDFKQRISFALGSDIGASLLNLPDDVFAQFDKEVMADGLYYQLTHEDNDAEPCVDVLQDAISFETGMVDTSINTIEEVSNCYGILFGDMMRKNLVSKDAMEEVDLNIIKLGFLSALYGEDTLIDLDEKQQMIVDFNNDLIKRQAETFIADKKKEYIENITDDGFIFIEESAGNGEYLDLENEFRIVYIITDQRGDTVISTLTDRTGTDQESAYTLNVDEGIFPQAWIKSANKMQVGGKYIIHADYNFGFGESGLISPSNDSYMIKPYGAITIHSKVLEQGERYGAIKKRGQEVIANAKNKPNTVVDPSGFVLTTLEEGNGKKVPVGGDVKAHYILTNSEGSVIENSYMSEARGMPAPAFSLNHVVEGWQLGIPKMKEGGRYILVLPYYLAYGEMGNRGIDPYETLTFEIEILEAGAPGTLVN